MPGSLFLVFPGVVIVFLGAHISDKLEGFFWLRVGVTVHCRRRPGG